MVEIAPFKHLNNKFFTRILVRLRWTDNIKMNLNETDFDNESFMKPCEDQVQYWHFISVVLSLCVPKQGKELCDHSRGTELCEDFHQVFLGLRRENKFKN